jgi:hypothetical protein
MKKKPGPPFKKTFRIIIRFEMKCMTYTYATKIAMDAASLCRSIFKRQLFKPSIEVVEEHS